MRTLKFLLQKEFLQIFRDKVILRMIIVLPVMQLLILPWAATLEQRNIMLSVVDNDHSSYSSQLVNKVLSSGYFILSDYSNSYAQALKSVESDQSDLILEIPHGFEQDFMRGQKPSLLLAINAVNGQKAGLGSSYIASIIADYNAEKMQAGTTLKIDSYYRYNTSMSFRNYMVPGILVMLLTIVGGMLSALNIVKEKEIGTIEQINVTPVSKITFIMSKLIPFWVIGLVILTIGMILIRVIYGLYPQGSFLTIYTFAFLYLVAFTGLGLFISTFSSTQQQAMFVIFFFQVIFFLLSGLFTPISSMPEWAQTITKFNPIRYFVEVMRMVFMKGSTFSDILSQLLTISVFAVVFNVAAIINYRKTS